MTRIKILGLALVAVFAFAAISVASASAGTAPALFECAKAAKEGKTYLGHHDSKTCSDAYMATGGKYELKEGIGKGKAFKSSGSTATLHTVDPAGEVDIPVVCSSFKGSGQYVNPTTVTKVITTFSKCKAESAPCQNVKKETIETKSLAGKFGWINKEHDVVGTDLANEKEPGGPVAEFTCSAIGEIHTEGSVIGTNAGNVKTIDKDSSLVFTAADYLGEVEYEPGKKYKPKTNIPEFEGGSLDILLTKIKGEITGHPEEFYPPEGLPSGQEGTSNQKGEALGIYEEGSE
jgi:hypothetical protein